MVWDTRMTLNTEIVKKTMKETGMVPKCFLSDIEIKNEETEFIPIKLDQGEVRHAKYFDCLQSNPGSAAYCQALGVCAFNPPDLSESWKENNNIEEGDHEGQEREVEEPESQAEESIEIELPNDIST